MTKRRRPRLTQEDIDNIFDAMQFVLAGEMVLYQGEDDEEERDESFRRTADKISRSL